MGNATTLKRFHFVLVNDIGQEDSIWVDTDNHAATLAFLGFNYPDMEIAAYWPVKATELPAHHTIIGATYATTGDASC
jgi:hypothetical protein